MDFISLILRILFIVLIISVIILTYHQYVLRRKLKNIPQRGRFPFGIALEVLKMTNFEIAQWYEQHLREYKDGIFVLWVTIFPFINIFKPDLLETIITSTINIEKGHPYELMESWLGKGLLTSTGEQWFHDRKLVGPTFHFGILDQFVVIMSEKAEILIKHLKKELAKNPRLPISIYPFINNVVLDVICETAMGVNIHAQEGETTYTATIHRVSKVVMDRCLRPWFWSDWLYNLMPSGKEYKSMINIIHKFTKEVIHKKKIIRQSQNYSTKDKNEDDIDKRERKAFLDFLLDQNEKDEFPLTDDELRAQVDTFMFEGHDTTAVAITWTLFLLGNNLEHQEEVHEELKEVFKDSETPASVKELSQLKYLERVIKEALRLYPSVPLISRKLSEDVKIGDYMFPKGVTITLSIGLMHRNPEIWTDPLKFDPDRFLPENSKHRNPYAYIPFSAGPRNCVGQKFALLEMKTILTAILRNWRVKSIKESVEFESTLILRPSEDIFVYLTPKNN